MRAMFRVQFNASFTCAGQSFETFRPFSRDGRKADRNFTPIRL
jgi:hypothetical protein